MIKVTVGLIIAMEEEFSSLESYISGRREIFIKGQRFVVGKINKVKIAVALAGIGKVNAARTTTTLSQNFSPECIISTGVAGGLGKLPKLSIFIADGLVQHDIDLTSFGRAKGVLPGMDSPIIRTTIEIKNMLKKVSSSANIGIIATGDQFIASEEKAKEIAEEFGALACDMESAAVAQVAKLEGIPFGVIRVISDDAGQNAHEDFSVFLEKAASYQCLFISKPFQHIKETLKMMLA